MTVFSVLQLKIDKKKLCRKLFIHEITFLILRLRAFLCISVFFRIYIYIYNHRRWLPLQAWSVEIF